MNVSVSEYHDFISDNNFQLAWGRLNRSSNLEVKDRVGLAVYGSQLNKHLAILRDRIDSKTFQPTNCENVYLPKKSGQERRYGFLCMDDRLVYQALGNVIIANTYSIVRQSFKEKHIFANIPTEPDKNGNWSGFVFEATFSRYFPWANQVIPGLYDLFLKELKNTVNEVKSSFRKPYLIRTDIQSFYPSINHKLLLKTVEEQEWLYNEHLRELLHECLTSWREHDDLPCGLPIGYETSDYLANLYLLSLDRAISEDEDCVRFIRFVDDIYIFVNGRSQANAILRKFDRQLKNLRLKRSTDKTKIIDLENESEENIERLVRINLSSLLDAKTNETKQDKLLDLLHEKGYKANSSDEFEPDNVLDSSIIGFVLYRSTCQNPLLRSMAFGMLEYFPYYSKHAITYLLTNYPDDKEIVDRLWDVAVDNNRFSKLRIDVLQGLNQLQYAGEVGKYLTQENFEDWYFRYLALDLIPQDDTNYFEFFYTTARQDTNPFVRHKATKIAFELADHEEAKIVLINLGIKSGDNFAERLGIYLWRRQVNIDSNELSLSYIRHLQDYFLHIDEIETINELESNFKKVFPLIKIHPDFPLEEAFGNRAIANQHFLNVSSRMDDNQPETDIFLDSAYFLTETLLNSVVSARSNNKIQQLALEELMLKHFTNDAKTINNVAVLRHFVKVSQNGYPHPSCKKPIVSQLSRLFEYHLEMLHIHKGLDLPMKWNEDSLFDACVEIIAEHCDTPEKQRTLIISAFQNCKLTQKIPFGHAAIVFAKQAVSEVIAFGECEKGQKSIVVLLQELKGWVGIKQQELLTEMVQVYENLA